MVHTENSDQEWLQIELDPPQILSKIKITNRSDCCGERMIGSVVKIKGTDNSDLLTYPISYNQAVYVWSSPFHSGTIAASSYMPEPVNFDDDNWVNF